MNAAFSRPQRDPYAQTYNPGWRNHPNFSWSQNNNDHSRSNHFQYPNHNQNSSYHQPNYHHNSSNHQSNYQQNFPNHAPQYSFQSSPLEKRMTDYEKTMERHMRNQESLIQTLHNNNTQAITRLEVQMSQLSNSQSERPKSVLPSQSVTISRI